eukprot:3594011-Amphidinium_carterae.1
MGGDKRSILAILEQRVALDRAAINATENKMYGNNLLPLFVLHVLNLCVYKFNRAPAMPQH